MINRETIMKEIAIAIAKIIIKCKTTISLMTIIHNNYSHYNKKNTNSVQIFPVYLFITIYKKFEINSNP